MNLRKQKQKNLHDPENGIFGDCYPTTLACMMNITRESVPHWWGECDDPDDKDQAAGVTRKIDKWLLLRKLRRVIIPYGGSSPEAIIESFSTHNPGTRFILGGESQTGVNHVVLCRDGEIEWDSSRVDSGIIGPCVGTEHYYVEVLVPAEHSN